MRACIAGKIWHRACFAAVAHIADQFGCRPDFRETISLIIRRFFMFISLSETRGRYRGRALLLCESLSTLGQTTGLPWLLQAIDAAASSIAVRRVPPYFRGLFAVNHDTVDLTVVHDLGFFAGEALDLKAFPFDPASRRAVLLPAMTKAAPAPPLSKPTCMRLPVVAPVDVAPKAAPAVIKSRRWKSPMKRKHVRAIVVRQTTDGDLRPVAAPAGHPKAGPRLRRVKAG
jgi:hypothetical protein